MLKFNKWRSQVIYELLKVFRINLDPICPDYRKVALAVIKAGVRAVPGIAEVAETS